jgi:hypothetical protein
LHETTGLIQEGWNSPNSLKILPPLDDSKEIQGKAKKGENGNGEVVGAIDER